MKKPRAIIIPLLLLSAQLQGADNTPPMAEMDKLITAGQFAQALKLGEENLSDWEGEDSDFDFLYGLAALEAGRPNDAVFALERVSVTSASPVLRSRARLELARAYFVTNNLTASENLFNQVLTNNPPTNVRQNIEAFLQLIETRRNSREATWNWSLSSIVGSDDNINSATNNGLIDTPLVGRIELNEDGQQTADSFSNTAAGVNFSYPLSRDRSIDVNANLSHADNFDTDAFDIDSLRTSASYNWGNAKNRFRHGLSATKVLLDQNTFQDSLAATSSWQRDAGRGWFQSVSATYSQIRFDTGSGGASAALRDIDQILLTGGLTKVAGLLTHSFNIYHAIEDPKNPNRGKHNGRSFSGAAYSMLYRMNPQHTPYLRASIQDVEHDSEHPVFFRTIRSDQTNSLTAGWLWQVRRQLTVTAEAAYTDNTSDIILFDFSRFRYQAGLRLNF
jgi:tetratricopeptide (TPR) repeat protein